MTDIIKSLAKGLTVLEALFADDFQGKTVKEISEITGFGSLAVRRALFTAQEEGWVVEVPQAGTKEACWKVRGSKLAAIAHAHERGAVKKVQAIKKEFHEISGRELEA